MKLYVFKRVLAAVPVLWGASLFIFLAVRLLPGSPAQAMLKERGSPEDIARINAQFGWDRPLLEQYLQFMGDVFLRGDLGRSYLSKVPVAQDLALVFPATLELAMAAMLLAVPAGVMAGTCFALWRHWASDLLFVPASLVGVSIPVFWLGLMLQILVYPSSQRLDVTMDMPQVTGLYLVDSMLGGPPGSFLSALGHLALPALALATIPMAVIARMTRASVAETLHEDYVRAARARGLGPMRVVLRYALRNALIPIATAGGLQFALLLGGAVLTETVFAWPGVGSFIVQAAENRDLPQIQGAALVVAGAFVFVNLLVDVSYALLDPRVRLAGGER